MWKYENAWTQHELGLDLIHIQLDQLKTSLKMQFVSIWLSIHVNTMWSMCPVYVCVCASSRLRGWRGCFPFFFFLSSLHVSQRNVYRKQTCFHGCARRPSYCCLLFMADWWGRGLGLEEKDRKHQCQVPEFIQAAQMPRLVCWGYVCLGLNCMHILH